MLETAIKAIIGITTLLGGWMLVQAGWRRVFPDSPADEDVMAGRFGCHRCPCDAPCEGLQSDKGEDGLPTPNQSKG